MKVEAIDAPEERGGQPFWQASQGQLAALVAGKTVTVTWDKGDRNGQPLDWIMDPEGTWVNKVMVLTGYAWWFERYAPDEEQFLKAQESAKDAKRGLWAEPMAVAPWDWRKGVRVFIPASDAHAQHYWTEKSGSKIE